MGVCVGHEPCPKCGSRDNLGRYDDGSGWCFGCHYYEPPSHFKFKPEEKPSKATDLPPDDVTDMLPATNQEWLEQYLEPDEIKQWFTYSPILRRHLFIHHTTDGFGKTHTFWEARSVEKDDAGGWTHKYPKTVFHGEKPFFIVGKWRKTGQLVLVEDIVSAIKVARHSPAMCLFGSNVTIDHMLQIANLPWIKEVVLWLDRDKYKEAMGFANRLGKFKNVRILSTEKDPKAQTDEDIKELLELT